MTCKSPGMSLRPPFSRPEEMHHKNTCRKRKVLLFQCWPGCFHLKGATVSWPAFSSAAVSRPSPFLQATISTALEAGSTFMRETHRRLKCLENAWKMLGKCLENAWKMLGKCLENAWRMLGKCLENAWKMLGKCLENAWKMLGKCLENAWKMQTSFSSRAWKVSLKALR